MASADSASSVVLESETRVDVYRNLQTGGFSVKSRETDSYGRVIAHRESVGVRDVEFVVRESGRQKVIEEERKNVHAFIRGVHQEVDNDAWDDGEAVEIMYNPYEYSSFVDVEEKRPVDSAEQVVVSTDGVFAVGVEFE